MNRAWPGRPNGHAMQRIAHALYAAFGPHATHAVDLHCWEKHAAPAILLHDLPGLRELARRLGHRFVDMRPVSEKTLVGQLCAAGRTGLTYECAGQYTVDEAQVQGALRVVVNLARLIGLLPGEPDPPDGPVLFSDETASAKVTAPCAGLFVKAPLPLGGRVDAGAVLGHLLTEHDLASLEVRAPAAGYLKTFGVGRPNCDVALPGHHPYVAKGELLATLVWPRTV
jgi:predicted deacylase